MLEMDQPLSIIILGATGDLAKKKLYPAVAALAKMKLIPPNYKCVGIGRREQNLDEMLAKQCVNVEGSADEIAKFKSHCDYHKADADPEDWASLHRKLAEFEGEGHGNRVFFLSVPPGAFAKSCQNIAEQCESTTGYTHVVIEKPFGRDSESFNDLNKVTSSLFKEEQIFRIDHYMGKEVVLNLTALRFTNRMLEPIWSREHIESISITMKEDLNTTGRGEYFDKFGIIRDIMQNHLLQVLIFLTTEEPESTGDISAKKLELLKCMEVLKYEDVFTGQFTTAKFLRNGVETEEPGYTEDPGPHAAPKDSKTPTFAQLRLRINNKRWKDVPIFMTAGKGMDERMAEVRVTFKPKQRSMFGPSEHQNELVMRIQPHESIYMTMTCKEPGLEQVIKPVAMAMDYDQSFMYAKARDAYERMFLYAIQGDNSLFVGSEELVEAWRVFTPMLHDIDNGKVEPVKYPFGSAHPPGSIDFAARHGIKLRESWKDFLVTNASDCEKMKGLFESVAGCRTCSEQCFLDENGVREFVKAFYDGVEPTPERLATVWGHLDIDKNKKVTWDEFLKAAKTLGEKPVDESKLDHTSTGPLKDNGFL